MAIKKLINTYTSKKRRYDYCDGIIYEAEGPDGMIAQLDKELRAYRDVVVVEFDGRGKGSK